MYCELSDTNYFALETNEITIFFGIRSSDYKLSFDFNNNDNNTM